MPFNLINSLPIQVDEGVRLANTCSPGKWLFKWCICCIWLLVCIAKNCCCCRQWASQIGVYSHTRLMAQPLHCLQNFASLLKSVHVFCLFCFLDHRTDELHCAKLCLFNQANCGRKDCVPYYGCGMELLFSAVESCYVEKNIKHCHSIN